MLVRMTGLGSVSAAVIILMSVFAGSALAHCDAMDGPVITLAAKALEQGDVDLVLPWVEKEKEDGIREAFALAYAVRGKGAKERQLADRYFFETLVRVHREGEGAPFTGLKPAGLDLGPAIPAADKALETGDPKPLLQLIEGKIHEGIHKYYTEAKAKKAHAGESIEAGREFVHAYVPYIHFVERLHEDATAPVAHGAGEGTRAMAGHPEPATPKAKEHKY